MQANKRGMGIFPSSECKNFFPGIFRQCKEQTLESFSFELVKPAVINIEVHNPECIFWLTLLIVVNSQERAADQFSKFIRFFKNKKMCTLNSYSF